MHWNLAKIYQSYIYIYYYLILKKIYINYYKNTKVYIYKKFSYLYIFYILFTLFYILFHFALVCHLPLSILIPIGTWSAFSCAFRSVSSWAFCAASSLAFCAASSSAFCAASFSRRFCSAASSARRFFFSASASFWASV